VLNEVKNSADWKNAGNDAERLRAIVEYVKPLMQGRSDLAIACTPEERAKMSTFASGDFRVLDFGSKKTDCVDRADYLYFFMKNLMPNVEHYIIVSTAKNHEWNIVKFGGKWYHLDLRSRFLTADSAVGATYEQFDSTVKAGFAILGSTPRIPLPPKADFAAEDYYA
jgi:hypothetical protein